MAKRKRRAAKPDDGCSTAVLFSIFVLSMTLCFGDLVFLYLAVQRSATDAESERGLCLVAAVFLQRSDDHFAFAVVDGTAE